MITHEQTFENINHATRFYYEWLPDDGIINAIVFIVHGHGEHSGRYRHVAEVFTQAGFACYGIDHMGHGKSSGDRVYIPDMALAVADLRQLFEAITTQYPDKPVLMFGHSMGSLIALQFTLKYQSDLRGLVLTGTAITGEDLQPSWLVSVALMASKVIPKARLSPPLQADVLSTDPDAIIEWANDPHTWKKMWRIGTSAAMIQAGRDIRPQIPQLTLPLLIMHGGADELTPTSGATFIQEHANTDDITVKIYAGLRHELVNEICRAEIIDEITQWLLKHS
jgi:alpha-beta hydrolase superfamily lysophospholipase